jgi:hypothetical protein
MSEFEQKTVDLQKFVALSRESFKAGWKSFYDSEQVYRQIEKLRQVTLQNILKEKGLAVCSWPHLAPSENVTEERSEEQMGIFSRDQTRMLFYYFDSSENGSAISLRRYCPEHFAKFSGKEEYVSESLINGEVIKQGEKFILKGNGQDIEQFLRYTHAEREPDGMPLHCVNVAIYRHFGIPDLPQKPELSGLDRSY